LASLRERLDDVRARIANAAAVSGRPASAVTLVGVVKTVPPERVLEAVELGLADLGENRVQEAEQKIAAVGRDAARWHLVGHLQSNKAGRAIELFDRIQSLDSERLAGALSRHALHRGRVVRVMIEVNVSGEGTKFGVAPDRLGELVDATVSLPSLRVEGLMTVGRPVARPDDARPDFTRLRSLRDEIERRIGRPLPELSMGMSGDFEVAIQEGATIVRVGTALFGGRA
jgi:pyridoxal phosphate enzyme (YggS family)